MTAPFSEPRKAARLMATFNRPWYIAGGWAIDLFLGHQTRNHADVDLAILRRDQMALRDLFQDRQICKVLAHPDGGRREPWLEGDWLELPVHQLEVDYLELSDHPLEVLLNEAADGEWRFRRNQQVRLPLKLLCASTLGLPVLAPEVVLLYKAKAPRPEDEADFENTRGLLRKDQRRWLHRAVEASYPGHPWLERM